jgi:hypothetical protein
LTNAFSEVAIKSMHRYRWKATSYIVELTVNRRWPGIKDITVQTPQMDFEIDVYGEHWDQVTRRNVKHGDSRRWSMPVTLFGDVEGEKLRGEEQAARFFQTMREIQDALEGAKAG